MSQGLSRSTRRTTRRLRRKRAGELNIVSMIDILTVLVFFLLVNATGVSILGINLPEANAAPPKEPPRSLSVIVRSQSLTLADRSGPIKTLENDPATGYNLHGLSELLQQVKQRTPQEDKIILLLEPGIPYDALVQVMDAVRTAPTPDARGEFDLFPAISLGDAPGVAAPAGAPAAGTAPAAAAAPAGGAP